MKIQSKKLVMKSLVFAVLSSLSTIATSAETFRVVVKLKNADKPFAMSRQTTLRDGVSATQQNAYEVHQAQGIERKQSVESFVRDNKIDASHLYNNVYYGFAAELTREQLEQMKNDPNVAGVYEDKIYHLYDDDDDDEELTGNRTYREKRLIADWPQISPQAPLESGSSTSQYKGKDQHVYVIDTGIDINQNDFKGRVGKSFAAETCHWAEDLSLCPAPYSDDHSHGTHVAGTIAAGDNKINALGVAPEAVVHGIKVCTKAGRCPGSSILAGLNWAVSDMLSRGKPAVANLSLGGEAEQPPGSCSAEGYVGENAVAESYCNAALQGMVVVVAAGNSSDDAADYSPAGYNSTITVSSYTSYQPSSGEAVFTNFSNYGVGSNDWSDKDTGVVTIAAPGRKVLSLNRTHATTSMSGTSMASPAVAGAVALILEKFPQEMDYSAYLNVRQMLVDNAIAPSSYTNEPDKEGGEVNNPHNEGLLNVRFLDAK